MIIIYNNIIPKWKSSLIYIEFFYSVNDIREKQTKQILTNVRKTDRTEGEFGKFRFNLITVHVIKRFIPFFFPGTSRRDRNTRESIRFYSGGGGGVLPAHSVHT